ncbi:MAG: folylpolyglutamate synthase/dihydrofolate synthase family protein [Cyanobacteria bacterium P01_F01_bin.33]
MTAIHPPADFDAETYLDSLTHFGIQLGLERIEALLDVLGQPQQGLPVIHVAGTNGKGSVCALVSQAIAAAGYRVGRYTSPHLVDWRERIWVQGQWISIANWNSVLWQVKQALQAYPAALDPPTQFEVVTAAAWLYFRQQAVEIAVIEVGLGGRLDSTNAGISPCVSAITSIGWDHWQRLGNSLAAIAAEKAGIVRTGIPVVSAPQVPIVQEVLRARARELDAPLTVVEPARAIALHLAEWQGQTYPRPFTGSVQLENLAIALQILATLRQAGWHLPENAIQTGFADARWPGRLQWVELCDRKVLLDGAHNVPAAIALRQYLDTLPYPQRPTTWLMAVLKTKDAAGICQHLLRKGDRLYALPLLGHTAHLPAELIQIALAAQPHLSKTRALATLDHLPACLESIPDGEGPIIACGSLYLLGDIMKRYLEWQ